MTKSLELRSAGKCELCSKTAALTAMLVSPKSEEIAAHMIAVCHTCNTLLSGDVTSNPSHWRCLNESIWSEVPPVQVMAYRILGQLPSEDWAVDLKNMVFLDERLVEWAEAGGSASIIHVDSNGNVLTAGDTVTLIQDLNVKGANFTAKRGTAVRRIRLVHDNPEHIEGKVDGQHIVILTKYVKKS